MSVRTSGRTLRAFGGMALGAMLAGALPAHAQSRPRLASLDHTYDLLLKEFSGDHARETVAFVEQFWRQPGSIGFDTTIARVAGILARAGYVREDSAPPSAPLVYRIERRRMEQASWSPVDASLAIEHGPTLLRFATNRNMLAIGSFATPDTGVVAEVVDISKVKPDDVDRVDVAGKVVFAEGPSVRLAQGAIQRGALGVLVYQMPAYTRPELNQTSIQFGRFPADSARGTWAIFLSYGARESLKEALAAGGVRVRVRTAVDRHPADELTLVAEARGRARPGERIVVSAHVQEPGANDNASGVGTQAEMARVLAALVTRKQLRLERTVTFVWGDEIRAVARYLAEDSARAAGVKWGLSLDMVGENTQLTGGTFLIEKMPDPSAVWTRGDDHHTEWGGSPMTVAQLTPHWYNDFVRNRCEDVAGRVPGGWTVRTNPYEGGSDHTPFLAAKIPALLLWHFTDQFYHTDNDRLPMVSADEMRNSGVCALAVVATLASGNGATARFVVEETHRDALARLAAERTLSEAAIVAGGDVAHEREIITTWAAWYRDAIGVATEISADVTSFAARAGAEVMRTGQQYAADLGAH
ncbi:MAG: M28 family peptidase [Gemmatimonadota bacterium]